MEWNAESAVVNSNTTTDRNDNVQYIIPSITEGKEYNSGKSNAYKRDFIEKWASSNTKVAPVTQKGKIKAKRVGKAIIMVTIKRGATALVEVKASKTKVTAEKLMLTNVKI